MVPTKVVSNTVTMLTDTLPQLPDFRSQLLPCHPVEVFIHNLLPDALSKAEPPVAVKMSSTSHGAVAISRNDPRIVHESQNDNNHVVACDDIEPLLSLRPRVAD